MADNKIILNAEPGADAAISDAAIDFDVIKYNQRVIWTTIPDGRAENGTLRFSVTVTPQFEYEAQLNNTKITVTTLTSFPDFVDWPETIRGLLGIDDHGAPISNAPGFVLEFRVNDKSVRTTGRARLVSKVPDSNLWNRIFNEKTRVLGTPPAERAKYVVVPFVPSDLLSAFHNLYGSVATDLQALINPANLTQGVTGFFQQLDTISQKLGSQFPGASLLDAYQTSPVSSGQQGLQPGQSNQAPTLQNKLKNINNKLGATSGPSWGKQIRLALKQSGRYLGGLFIKSAHAAELQPATSSLLRSSSAQIRGLNVDDSTNLGHFQAHLALLQDYPALLRELGLVLDFEVEQGSIANSENVLVKVVPGGLKTGAISGGTSKFQTINIRPGTRCTLSDSQFRANNLPEKGSTNSLPSRWQIISNGLLDFAKPSFGLTQLDEDSVAITTISYIDQTDQSAEPGQVPKIPSIRDDGITLDYSNKHVLQSTLFQRWNKIQKIIKANSDPEYFAQDLGKGYRIDAFVLQPKKDEGKWYPLCRRTLKVKAGDLVREYGTGSNKDEHELEGQVSGLLSRIQNDPDNVYRMKPAIFNWRGWSLSVPPCGQSGNDSMVKIDSCTTTSPGGDLPNVTVQMKVAPGTLPLLRYGWRYRFRARIVDAAGNSMPTPDPATDPEIEIDEDESTISAEHNYRRIDPISSPVPVPARDLKTPPVNDRVISPGESVAHVVIRSNYRKDPGLDSYSPINRYFVPPPVSTRTIELHGKLDINGTFSPNNTLSTTAGKKTVAALINERQGRDVLGYQEDTNGTFAWPDKNGYFSTHKYLADPIARGVAFHGLPGRESAEPLTINYAGIKIDGDDVSDTWPDVGRIEFRLQEGERTGYKTDFSANAVHDNIGRLTVTLPKAETLTIEYSSFLADKDLELMYWYMQSQSPASDLKALSTSGRNWMLTPRRKMTLVHAVKQPLLNPAVVPVVDINKTMRRNAGSTSVPVDAIVELHGKSTGEVDLTAVWDEYVFDAGSNKGYRIVERKAHVLDTLIDLSGNVIPGINGGAGVYLPNNKTRSDALVLGGKAYEALVAAQTGDASNTEESMRPFAAKIPTAKKNTEMSSLAAPYLDIGDTKHHKIRFTATAVTRFREYFNPMRKGKGEDKLDMDVEKGFIRPDVVAGEAARRSIEVHIPSSVRPAAPEIDYIVPTFAWTETKSGGVITRKRIGRGLRVYLKGPWYSTGEDERLAVVLYPRGSGKKSVNEYVSRWNHDPVRRQSRFAIALGRNSRTYLTPDNFSVGVVDKPTALELAEVSTTVVKGHKWIQTVNERGIPTQRLQPVSVQQGAPVDAVTYDVKYDRNKKRFYCDIEFDKVPGYFPFVRLALARYQPYSVKGKHLSPVVKAEFMQLCPDRTAVVELVENNRKVRIRVTGVTHAGSKHPRIPLHAGIKGLIKKPGDTVSAPMRDPLTRRPIGNSSSSPSVHVPAGDIKSPLTTQNNDRKVISGSTITRESDKAIPNPAANGGNTNTITVDLELRIAGRKVEDPLAWEPSGSQATELAKTLSGWEGEITLPEDYAVNKYRIVIREHENYQAGASRVVYLDAVVL